MCIRDRPRPCDWKDSSAKLAARIERATKECGGSVNEKWKWISNKMESYVCKYRG